MSGSFLHMRTISFLRLPICHQVCHSSLAKLCFLSCRFSAMATWTFSCSCQKHNKLSFFAHWGDSVFPLIYLCIYLTHSRLHNVPVAINIYVRSYRNAVRKLIKHFYTYLFQVLCKPCSLCLCCIKKTFMSTTSIV